MNLWSIDAVGLRGFLSLSLLIAREPKIQQHGHRRAYCHFGHPSVGIKLPVIVEQDGVDSKEVSLFDLPIFRILNQLTHPLIDSSRFLACRQEKIPINSRNAGLVEKAMRVG